MTDKFNEEEQHESIEAAEQHEQNEEEPISKGEAVLRAINKSLTEQINAAHLGKV
jgi:hypothetical protein